MMCNPLSGKQAVDVGDTAVGGVFNGQHGQIGAALADGADHPFECGAGDGLHVRAGLQAGFVAVGTQGALKSDARSFFVGHRHNPWQFDPHRAFGRGNYTLLAIRESNRYPLEKPQ